MRWRALDDLTLDGVVLLSNVDGRYVGASEFDTVLAALDERRALVLLPPNEIPPLEEEVPLHAWAEYPIDATRAYARLALRDGFRRHRRIR